jgi:hypothetical protein
MLRLACVIGVVVGLAVSAVSTYRPHNRVVKSAATQQRSPGNLLGLPPNPVIKNGDSGEFIVEFEDHLFTVSKYANDIPFIMIGGRTLSINGGMSAKPQ